MTAYKDFIKDFPGRCLEVLKMAEEPATNSDIEVTLFIMEASAGFVIPFERVRPLNEGLHPSMDRKKYPEHAKTLDILLKEKFLGSQLHLSKTTKWLLGELRSIEGAPDEWLDQKGFITIQQMVGPVLGILRNALAHGHIDTKGNPIELILFVSKKNPNDTKAGYRYLGVPPAEFVKFLENWFRFLAKHKITLNDACQIFDSSP